MGWVTITGQQGEMRRKDSERMLLVVRQVCDNLASGRKYDNFH